MRSKIKLPFWKFSSSKIERFEIKFTFFKTSFLQTLKFIHLLLINSMILLFDTWIYWKRDRLFVQRPVSLAVISPATVRILFRILFQIGATVLVIFEKFSKSGINAATVGRNLDWLYYLSKIYFVSNIKELTFNKSSFWTEDVLEIIISVNELFEDRCHLAPPLTSYGAIVKIATVSDDPKPMTG